jgi:hypothetical protein
LAEYVNATMQPQRIATRCADSERGDDRRAIEAGDSFVMLIRGLDSLK